MRVDRERVRERRGIQKGTRDTDRKRPTIETREKYSLDTRHYLHSFYPFMESGIMGPSANPLPGMTAAREIPSN